MNRTNKVKIILFSVLSFMLGLILGVIGNIALSLPASYKIPKTLPDVSHVEHYDSPNLTDSTTLEAGAEVINSSDLSIHFLELGNRNTGDCIFIQVKNGNTNTDILIDGGSKTSSIPYIEEYVDKYCTDGVLDFVIITHAHEDHYAGYATNQSTESLFDHYTTGNRKIDKIITFALTNKSDNATMHKNYLRELGDAILRGAKHYTALDCYNETKEGAQNMYTLGEDSDGNTIVMQILSTKFYTEHSTTENNYSVCMQIVQGTKKYLFTGDLEEDGEQSLLEQNAGLISQVELYKAGHHGSKTSSSAALMQVIRPKIVVVCCVAGSSEYTSKNENQFPTQAFIDNVSIYTDKIYVTSLCIDYQSNQFTSFNGNIAICSKGKEPTNVVCSNNTTVLQDTDWFKNNRKLPENAYRAAA